MGLFHLRGTRAPFAILTALSFACGAEVETASSIRATGNPCGDCSAVKADLTVDEPNGVFDIQVDAFPNFDSSGVSTIRVEFKRGSQTEYADLGFAPEDIEGGVGESGIELPGSLDYTVNSGLTARMVYDDPPSMDLAESSTNIYAAQ